MILTHDDIMFLKARMTDTGISPFSSEELELQKRELYGYLYLRRLGTNILVHLGMAYIIPIVELENLWIFDWKNAVLIQIFLNNVLSHYMWELKGLQNMERLELITVKRILQAQVDVDYINYLEYLAQIHYYSSLLIPFLDFI